MTLQYNILQGQPDRPTRIVRVSPWRLAWATAGSVAVHALGATVALPALGAHGPVVESTDAIVVFIEPNAPPVATASESKSEAALELPPQPEPPLPPLPDFAPPPPEALAPPDFKTPPPPPPPRPAQSAPRPPPPQAKVAPSHPATAAPAARPAPAAVPPPAAPPAAAPSVSASVAPGWNALLATWLAAHKTYPDAARRRGEEGEVTVRFVVSSDGRIVEVALVKGSGSAALDSAALSMLRGAALPPPGTDATRTVRIRFRLND